MRWLGQVRHVIAKDARHSAIPIVCFVLLIAASSISIPVAIAPDTTSGIILAGTNPTHQLVANWTILTPLCVIILAMLFVASAVQDDSLTRAGAYWRTKPFDASAIVAAKISGALLLLAIALSGEAIALRRIGVSLALLPSTLAWASTTMIVCLGAILILASVTDNLIACFIALIASPICLALAASLWPDAWADALGARLLLIVGIAGACSLLWAAYSSRIGQRVARIASIVVAGCILGWYFVLSESCASNHPAPALASHTPMQLRYAPDSTSVKNRHPGSSATVSSKGEARTSFPLPLYVGMADAVRSERHVLVNATATVTLPDGSSFKSELEPWGVIITPGDSVPFAFPILLGGPCKEELSSQVTIMVTQPQRVALRNGFRSIAIDGEIYVATPRMAATIPLNKDATLATPRGRIAMSKAIASDQGYLIAERSSEVTVARDLTYARVLPIRRECAVINERTRYAAPLFEATGSNQTTLGLVLPGPMIALSEHVFRLTGAEMRFDPGFVSESAWLQGAKLAVVEWNVVGSYHTSASLMVPR